MLAVVCGELLLLCELPRLRVWAKDNIMALGYRSITRRQADIPLVPLTDESVLRAAQMGTLFTQSGEVRIAANDHAKLLLACGPIASPSGPRRRALSPARKTAK